MNRESSLDGRPIYTLRERLESTGQSKFFFGGGTPFSKIEKGVRVGGISNQNIESFIGRHFADLVGFIDPIGSIVYEGLSEDFTYLTLEDMTGRMVKVINSVPHINSFLLSCGSDNLEAVIKHLHVNLEDGLISKGITIDVFWSNNPLPSDTLGMRTLHTAMSATRTKRPGGLYLAADEKSFPAIFGQKETYHGDPMILFDRRDREAVAQEENRRNYVGNLMNRLAIRFFNLPILDFIEKIEDPTLVISTKPFTAKPNKSIFVSSHSSEVFSGSRLWALATSLTNHLQDKEGLVMVKHLNNMEESLQVEKFDSARALLIVLNHSATTSIENARILKDYFIRRKNSKKPILIVAVTENAEPKVWDPQEGIYPSGVELQEIVMLLPYDVKTAHLKLLAVNYDEFLNPKHNLNPTQVIDFLCTDFEGEIIRSPLESNILSVKKQYQD